MAGSQTKQTLVDNRGIGKPSPFSGKESDLNSWARKLETYVASDCDFGRIVLKACVEATTPIDVDSLGLAIE